MPKARQKISDHLTRFGATSAGSAVSYIPTRKSERKALTYLQRQGVVSLAEGGRYWIDEDKLAGQRGGGRTRTAMILGGAIAAAAAVFALRARSRRDRSDDQES